MYCLKKLGLLVSLSICSYQAFAIDPIAQTVSPAQLPTTVHIGDSLSATYTLTNNKKNPVKLTITSTSVGNGIIVHDQCNGKTLAKKGDSGSQCTINVSLDPTAAGPLSWQGMMHYDFNQVPLKLLSTTVTGQTGQVTGSLDQELPAQSELNHTPPYPFTFRFTNSGTADVTGNGSVSANVSSYQVTDNQCLNKTLTPGNFCLIKGTFTAAATGAARIEGTFLYNPGNLTATVATETFVTAPMGQVTATTTIPLPNPTVVNQGPYSFRFRFVNNGPGAVTGRAVINAHGAPVAISNPCSVDAQLNAGNTCIVSGTFSPVATGDVTINADYVYNNGVDTAATSTETNVQAAGSLVAQVVTGLPPNAVANTNYPVAFRFTNNTGQSIKVQQQLSLPNVTGIVNDCPNDDTFFKAPDNVCNITGTFNSPGSSSVQTLSVQLSPVPPGIPPAIATTQTLTQANAGVFVSFYPRSLRVSAGAINMPYQFQYNLVNNNTSATNVTIHFNPPPTVTLVPSVTPVAPNSPSDPYFTSYYYCGNAAPPVPINFNPTQPLSFSIPGQGAAGTCSIFVTFLATSTVPPNPYTDNFDLVFDTPTNPNTVTPISYATGQAITENGNPLTRTITFKNNCTYDVHYALHGASVQAKNQSAVTCSTNADCFNGSSCTGGECLWVQPTPNNGFKLTHNASTSVQIPLYDNAIKLNISSARDVTWGGNLAGRAGCANGACIVNDCGADPSAPDQIGKCPTGIGSARAPISASEFTLQADDPLVYSNQTTPNLATDNYNVQLIDGVTVPSSMEPTNGTFAPGTPYVCGGAGLKTSQAPLASCSWNFIPPDPSNFLWVQYPTGTNPVITSCTDSSQCGAITGAECGLMVNPNGTAHIQKACGIPVTPETGFMYWTADAVCKIDPTYNAPPFLCASQMSSVTDNENTGTILIPNIYACTGPELGTSCYSSASDTCCGCANWGTSPVGTQQCGAINPGWTNQVLPLIQWQKDGCPTAYAYPYDDASSSFTCLVNKVLTAPEDSYDGNVNTTNYEVEFCPQ